MVFCVDCCQVKNQHLTVQNKRRRLEWCSSMLERLGETKGLWEVSRKRRISRKFSGHCSLCSIPRFKRSFLCGFLWFFRSESRGVFLVVLVVWCCLPRKIRTMFLLLLSCSRPITHGDDALASSRQLLQKCSSATSSGRTSPFSGCASSPTIRTRGSVGVSHISQLSRHMSFSQPSPRAQHCHPSLHLNVESGFRHIFEHSSACGNMVIFSPVPLSSSLSLPRIWLSRSTSKIDALDDDETPLRLTASQTDTTRRVMVSGIMGACDIAPSLHFVELGLKLNAEEWIKVMDEYIVCPIAQPSWCLGVFFYGSWPTRRRTLPGCLVNTAQHSVARHSRISTALLSRPLSLRLLFVERAQSTACSASSSTASYRSKTQCKKHFIRHVI